MFNFYSVHVGWPIGTMPSKTDEYTDICRQFAFSKGQSGIGRLQVRGGELWVDNLEAHLFWEKWKIIEYFEYFEYFES